MVKALIATLFLLSPSLAHSRAVVAVIDTGLDIHDKRFTPHLCRFGHKDFTGTGLQDDVGHGTAIVGTIIAAAGNADYCIVVLKYFELNKRSMEAYGKALESLLSLSVDVVNISTTGKEFDENEMMIIRTMFRTLFVVAAGNNGRLLSYDFCVYPACLGLDNIRPIGAKDKFGKQWLHSNYGPYVFGWEPGEDITVPAIGFGSTTASGTSISTAVYTGKYLNVNYPFTF